MKTIEQLIKYRSTWGDTKQALIDGGFDYSEMHDSYRNIPNTPFRRKSIPAAYKSEVTGKQYSYDEYCNHGWGEIKQGYLDLPHDEYPYTVIFKPHQP